MKKITQLDYQIMILEKMGPNISPMEKCKLDNLKEQKCIMQENGIELTPTMKPFKNAKSSGSSKQKVGHRIAEARNLGGKLTNKPAPTVVEKEVEKEVVKEVVKDFEKGDVEVLKNGAQVEFQDGSGLKINQGKVGLGGSSAFLMYQHYEREQLVVKNPGGKLNLPSVRLAWSEKSESEKSVFKDMAKLERKKRSVELLGDLERKSFSHLTEKKLRRKIADKKYREKKCEEQSEKKVEDDSLKELLKVMIERKEEELQELVIIVENLKSGIVYVQKERKETVEKVVAKDVEIMVTKEQIKALHKIHKSCA